MLKGEKRIEDKTSVGELEGDMLHFSSRILISS